MKNICHVKISVNLSSRHDLYSHKTYIHTSADGVVVNSRKFSYSKIFYLFLVLKAKKVVATFHLHYLGHRIKYGNREVGNTTQQLLSTTRPCCIIEFIESFLFWVILITYNTGICICIYIYKIRYIHSFFVIFSCSVFPALHAKHFDIKKSFVKLISRLLHSTINQVMWYFWVFIVNQFPLLWSVFFLKKTAFPLVSLSLVYRWVNQLRDFW